MDKYILELVSLFLLMSCFPLEKVNLLKLHMSFHPDKDEPLCRKDCELFVTSCFGMTLYSISSSFRFKRFILVLKCEFQPKYLRLHVCVLLGSVVFLYWNCLNFSAFWESCKCESWQENSSLPISNGCVFFEF